MTRHEPIRRRSFVLIAVLVVIGSSLLVATSLLFVAQTESAASAGSREVAQSRALAWSGLQVVMAQLNDQREAILRGETPILDNHRIIYESGNRHGVVQLLPVSGHDGDAVLVAEAGKLGLNAITIDALIATGVVSPDEAQAIVAHRDAASDKRLQSVMDLLRVPGAGISAERIFGPVDELQSGEASRGHAGPAQAVDPQAEAELVYRGLADLLTVHGDEPLLQASGDPRINLNVPWSDELGQRVAARFDRDAADLLKSFLEGGMKFDSDARIVSALIQMQVAPEEWAPILDAFSTTDQPIRTGRLDINSATAEALRGLPGITEDQAAQMVRVRSELSADERATIAWPVLAQIITPEQFVAVVDRITNRSWTYRVRIAAGEMMGDEADAWIGHTARYEAVIDLSSSRPRVAYLRDITLLAETAAIAAEARSRTEPLDGVVIPPQDQST
jgi:DNA uptake protein ComE-like DNA-binding protein